MDSAPRRADRRAGARADAAAGRHRRPWWRPRPSSWPALGAGRGPRRASACPAAIVGGRVPMAANIDQSWIGVERAASCSREAIGRPVRGAQRRRRRRRRRDALRRGQGRHGRRARADARHRDRLGAVRRRRARAEPGARPHRDPRQGRRAARLGRRARAQGPVAATKWAPLLDEYLDRIDAPGLAGPDHPGRRHLASKREKFMPCCSTCADRAGHAPERGRASWAPRCGRASCSTPAAAAAAPATRASARAAAYPGRICTVTRPMPGSAEGGRGGLGQVEVAARARRGRGR